MFLVSSLAIVASTAIVAQSQSLVADLQTFPLCTTVIKSGEFARTPSTAGLSALFDILGGVRGPGDASTLDVDRRAAQVLKGVDPISDAMLYIPGGVWDVLLNRCVLDETQKDTLLIRIYRGGLVRTAELLYRKKFYDRTRYLFARAADGKNILHFAVLSRNADMVRHIAAVLKEDVIRLMEGNIAVDNVGLTPVDMAFSQPTVPVIHMLEKIYGVYKDAQLPSRDVPRLGRQVAKPLGETGYLDAAAAVADIEYGLAPQVPVRPHPAQIEPPPLGQIGVERRSEQPVETRIEGFASLRKSPAALTPANHSFFFFVFLYFSV